MIYNAQSYRDGLDNALNWTLWEWARANPDKLEPFSENERKAAASRLSVVRSLLDQFEQDIVKLDPVAFASKYSDL